jgi:5-methylcytosine-specific restriction endonuclease McrA
VRIDPKFGGLVLEQLEPSTEGEMFGRGQMKRLRQKQPRLKLDPESYEALKTEVLERDGWRCQDCGSATMLAVHHLQPRSKLGHDTSDNLITLCVYCHGRRHRL